MTIGLPDADGNQLKDCLGNTNLVGQFVRDSSNFIYRAADEAAHKGYKLWHRAVDKEVVDWIHSTPAANPEQFVGKLQEIYNRADIAIRIPNVNLPKLFGL